MIIKNGKTTYDLTNSKKVISLKRVITGYINNHNTQALENLRKQLEELHNTGYDKNLAAQEIYQKICDGINEINKVVIMDVTFRNKPYNLNNPQEVKALLKKITCIIKLKKSAEYKLKILDQLKNDLIILEEDLNSPKDILHSLKIQIEKSCDLINNQKNTPYQLYTTRLHKEFSLPVSNSNQKLLSYDEQSVLALLKKFNNPENLEHYLQKSVTQKLKTGQKSFQALSTCFWFDFYCGQQCVAKEEKSAQRLLYINAVAQFYLHNASIYPAQGYGKSQKREKETPLFYFRSQVDHLYLKLAPSQQTANGLQNLLFKEVVTPLLSENFKWSTQWQALTVDGNLDKNILREEKVNYFGTFLAHAGSRTTNPLLFEQQIGTLIAQEGIKALQQQNVLPYDSTLLAPNTNKKNVSLKPIMERFGEIATQLQDQHLVNDLPSVIAQERSVQAKKIMLASQELKNIKVSYSDKTGFVVFELYPEWQVKLRETDNFKQGLTNVLLGFLGGLINANAKKMGLHLYVQRRQSFGFLRPTLTDVGTLKIRLSLGLEPAIFAEVVSESLQQLDTILSAYNFTEPQKSTAKDGPELITKVLTPCEGIRGKQATTKTGNYLLYTMRTEDDQWMALPVAEKHLAQISHEIPEQEKPVTAFGDYLQNFVLARGEYKQVSQPEKHDHKQIKRDGFTMFNTANVLNSNQNSQTEPKDLAIFQLLHNLIIHTVRYMAELKPTESSFSMTHLFAKILGNCEKGIALLSNLKKYEVTHLYVKANLLVENILEYLIPLRALVGIEPHMAKQLEEREIKQTATALKLTEKDLQLFYHDSCQQATTTWLALLAQQQGKEKLAIYFFTDSYFEISAFCEEVSISSVKAQEKAALWFCDVAQIAQLNTAIATAKSLPKTIIIDLTNNSSKQMLQDMQGLLTELRQKKVWVVLVCSSLKHEQLGLDKYQSGRSIVIPPESETMSHEQQKTLQQLSAQAMHPLIASFRILVSDIASETPQETQYLSNRMCT